MGSTSNATAAQVITRTYREEWARILAGLVRRYGDLDVAEEATAEAFATAAARWPDDGVPPNPAGWITTAAQRKAIDRLRRDARKDAKQQEAFRMLIEPADPVGPVDDDRLRLMFICCHPALTLESRVVLTLRILGGLTVPEIAHAFLAQETTIGQRISRAKAKLKSAEIPFLLPTETDLAERVSGVLAVLYLIFNEGYLASGEDTPPIRRDLTAESIRLTRLLHELLPADREVSGLLALMLLTEARADARVSAEGELVRLDEQDRGSWDRDLADEGLALLDRQPNVAEFGRYELLAAINAVHIRAAAADGTDWARIVILYEYLERLDPNPIVGLNKAIAIAQLDSPEAALAVVDGLAEQLGSHYAFHATRAELLRTLGRTADSGTAYDVAIGLAGNPAQASHLARRRDELPSTTEERNRR